MTDDRLLMHALADDQLSAEERKNAEDHLAACPQCRAEFEAVGSLKKALQTRLEPVDTEGAWKACRRRLDEIDRASRVQSFVTRYAWGFCTLFAVIILSASMLNHFLGRNRLHTGELAGINASMIPGSNPNFQNPAEMQKWVRKAVGTVPMNLGSNAVHVLRGATGMHDGRRAIRLDLQDRNGAMELFVVLDAESVDGLEWDAGHDYYVGKMNDMNCVAWSQANCSFLLIGDRQVADLCRVAEVIGVK